MYRHSELVDDLYKVTCPTCAAYAYLYKGGRNYLGTDWRYANSLSLSTVTRYDKGQTRQALRQYRPSGITFILTGGSTSIYTDRRAVEPLYRQAVVPLYRQAVVF